MAESAARGSKRARRGATASSSPQALRFEPLSFSPSGWIWSRQTPPVERRRHDRRHADRHSRKDRMNAFSEPIQKPSGLASDVGLAKAAVARHPIHRHRKSRQARGRNRRCHRKVRKDMGSIRWRGHRSPPSASRRATSVDRESDPANDLGSRRPANPAFAAPIHTRVLARYQAVEPSVGRPTASAPCPQRFNRGAGARIPIAAGAVHCVGKQRLRAARR